MQSVVKINCADNVGVAVANIPAGTAAAGVVAAADIPCGHKIALCDIPEGADVIKYGKPIGRALCGIKAGEWIHTHNLVTKLDAAQEYEYKKCACTSKSTAGGLTFSGYENADGSVGVRNEIWIIPLVGCANKTGEKIREQAQRLYGELCDGIFCLSHPYGCSQMGDDGENTARALAALAKHPNAAGVLLLSLGCENLNFSAFEPYLGDYDRRRIRLLVMQESEDEITDGVEILGELARAASERKRTQIGIDRLVVGFKCGGSDGFSGITANPLCGALTDKLVSMGASAVLTEVPEMFGAEARLMERAASREIFDKTVKMINDFKDYYISHGQPVYDNPSPGNKAGGITTLEEKSLGCILKGGTAEVTDVLGYAEGLKKPGLSLLTGPGNDIVSCTNLAASGAHIIVFTTGRGTPLGAPVPTLKISTNTALYEKKRNWIDYDAGRILQGIGFEAAADELLELVLQTASGAPAKNETGGYRDFAVFKNGVTL